MAKKKTLLFSQSTLIFFLVGVFLCVCILWDWILKQWIKTCLWVYCQDMILNKTTFFLQKYESQKHTNIFTQSEKKNEKLAHMFSVSCKKKTKKKRKKKNLTRDIIFKSIDRVCKLFFSYRVREARYTHTNTQKKTHKHTKTEHQNWTSFFQIWNMKLISENDRGLLYFNQSFLWCFIKGNSAYKHTNTYTPKKQKLNMCVAIVNINYQEV